MRCFKSSESLAPWSGPLAETVIKTTAVAARKFPWLIPNLERTLIVLQLFECGVNFNDVGAAIAGHMGINWTRVNSGEIRYRCACEGFR